MTDDVTKQRADAQFRKAQQAKDGKAAMAEYEAAAIATRAKTNKLREQRLAREAEIAANPPPPPPPKTKTKAVKKTKKAAPKLSAWLDDQKSSGRNT